MRERFDAVATMQYNIVEFIDVIFNEVYNLREIAELATRPYTDVQMVDLGYIVLSKLPIIRSNIRKWICHNPSDQTWLKFQATFTEVHQELRETDASVDEIDFQSTNTIISQIVQKL